MKVSLSNLTDALVFLLRGLYDAERKLQKAIPPCSTGIRTESVRRVVDHYYDSAGNKILKLERVFNYLMTEPHGRSHEVMEKMIDDTNHILRYATNDRMRDVILLTCIQNINYYKIAGYRNALLFSVELRLDNVSDLLTDILEWETGASREFAEASLKVSGHLAGNASS
jgi:ferritin-like metal-binding protein YciE